MIFYTFMLLCLFWAIFVVTGGIIFNMEIPAACGLLGGTMALIVLAIGVTKPE